MAISATQAAELAQSWLWKIWPGGRARQAVVQEYARIADHRLAMEDLARFCFVRETTAVVGDSHKTAEHEGRRQAFLHICEMAGVDPILAVENFETGE